MIVGVQASIRHVGAACIRLTIRGCKLLRAGKNYRARPPSNKTYQGDLTVRMECDSMVDEMAKQVRELLEEQDFLD